MLGRKGGHGPRAEAWEEALREHAARQPALREIAACLLVGAVAVVATPRAVFGAVPPPGGSAGIGSGKADEAAKAEKDGAAGAPAPDMEAARRHFMAGTEALRAGDPARAAREFEAAYQVTRDPVILLAAAEAYRKAGAVERALGCYETYLARSPEAPDREEVARQIRELRARAQAQGKAKAATAGASSAHAAPAGGEGRASGGAPGAAQAREGAEPRVEDRARAKPVGGEKPEEGAGSWSRLRIAAWVTASSAVALLATGGLMTLRAKNVETDLDHRMRAVDPQTGQPLPYASVEPEIRSLRSQGKRYETLSVVFYATAAAAGIAAGTMFSIEHRRKGKERRPRFRVAPHLASGGAGMVAGIEF